MGVSIYNAKYNFFLHSLTIPFFQKIDFSEGKSGIMAFFWNWPWSKRQEKPKRKVE